MWLQRRCNFTFFFPNIILKDGKTGKGLFPTLDRGQRKIDRSGTYVCSAGRTGLQIKRKKEEENADGSCKRKDRREEGI